MTNPPPPPATDALAEQLLEAARRERPLASVKARALERAAHPIRPITLSPLRRLLAAAVLGAACLVLAGVVLLGEDGPRASVSAETITESTTQSTDRSTARASRTSSTDLPWAGLAQPNEDSPSHADLTRAAGTPPPSAVPRMRPASLEDELEMLDRARQALLDGKPDTALAELAQYDRLAPARRLGAEASLLRIQVLAKAGRAAEAARLATEFIATHPDSPLVDRAKSFIAVPTAADKSQGVTP